MKTYFLAFLIVIILFSSASSGFASCMTPNPIKKEAENAALIFIGKVVKITPAQLADVRLMSNKNLKWEKYFSKTDLVTFSVIEAFKGVSSDTIEIATSAEGDANYKFEGGTWLKEGQTYLVYANKTIPAGTIDENMSDSDYSPAVAAELRKIQKSIPKELAFEVNQFNSKVSEFYASVCGRTLGIEQAEEEIRRVREIFPESQKFSVSKNEPENSATISIRQRILNIFGLA